MIDVETERASKFDGINSAIDFGISDQNHREISTQLSELKLECEDHGVELEEYQDEATLARIIELITKDLSEPYSIYTYRYFIHNWPFLCFMAKVDSEIVGAIVCKLDEHKKGSYRGYIAMLAVDKEHRRKKIGSSLVQKAIQTMIDHKCEEVVLETEITNEAALNLYQQLGFVRDKRLLKYYLNGVDAFRLKLWLR